MQQNNTSESYHIVPVTEINTRRYDRPAVPQERMNILHSP